MAAIVVGVAVFTVLALAPPAPVLAPDPLPPPAPEVVQWTSRRRGLIAGMIVGGTITGAGFGLLAGGLVAQEQNRICPLTGPCPKPASWTSPMVRGSVAVIVVGGVILIPTAIAYVVGRERVRKLEHERLALRPAELMLRF